MKVEEAEGKKTQGRLGGEKGEGKKVERRHHGVLGFKGLNERSGASLG